MQPDKPKLLAAKRMPLRYLVAGGWNTLFGYSAGVGLYKLLSPILHIIVIAIIANILAISMSFLTYKLFVFRTKGNWLQEYMRTYAVYGIMGVAGALFLWGLLDFAGLNIWLSQGLVIICTVWLSYLGHSRFTFRV